VGLFITYINCYPKGFGRLNNDADRGESQMTELRSVFIPILLLSCCLVLGCGKKAAEPSAVSLAPEKKESLEEKVNRLQRDLFLLKMQVGNMSGGSADISTEEKGYSVAQTKFGSFAVVCRNVTPYLDGYKVQLGVGNLTNAHFNGAKMSLLWGADYSKTKDMSVTNSFPPGRYTNVEVVLTPAKPEDIKTFSVTFDFDQLALYR